MYRCDQPPVELPFYVYDEQASPSGNLIRATLWIEQHMREKPKRLQSVLTRAKAEFPNASEEVVRDGLYGQLLIYAVATWADEELLQERQRNYDAALSMLRKWRRRWDETSGADETDPWHQHALLEWLQMKVRKYP